MSNKIVLTGGGSAGHVTPNLALVPDLQQKGYDVHYIGTEDGIEREIVQDLPYHTIVAGKLRRYFSFENFTDIFRVFKGYWQAKAILKKMRPSLVFAKGGFVSVPVVWAAAHLKIPTVLHESDYTPGLANRLNMRKAEKICLSFNTPEIQNDKTIVTGSPVRQELFEGSKEKGLELLGFDGNKKVLLVMGGSQGAKAINDTVDQSISQLTERFHVVHLRGPGNLNKELASVADYKQYEYVQEELADMFAASDIALSRAGANAIFEYLALKMPMLLVPLPLSASRGDQILNAKNFEENGFASVLEQEDLNCKSLLNRLGSIETNMQEYICNMEGSSAMNGTQNVLRVIYESINE